MGSVWLLHELGAFAKREHPAGTTPTGVTQFLGFPQVREETGVVLGIELGGDMDYLLLGIVKHVNLLKEGKVSYRM